MLMATGPVVKVNRPEFNSFVRDKLIVTALKLYICNPALQSLRCLIINGARLLIATSLSLTDKSTTE